MEEENPDAAAATSPLPVLPPLSEQGEVTPMEVDATAPPPPQSEIEEQGEQISVQPAAAAEQSPSGADAPEQEVQKLVDEAPEFTEALRVEEEMDEGPSSAAAAAATTIVEKLSDETGEDDQPPTSPAAAKDKDLEQSLEEADKSTDQDDGIAPEAMATHDISEHEQDESAAETEQQEQQQQSIDPFDSLRNTSIGNESLDASTTAAETDAIDTTFAEKEQQQHEETADSPMDTHEDASEEPADVDEMSRSSATGDVAAAVSATAETSQGAIAHDGGDADAGGDAVIIDSDEESNAAIDNEQEGSSSSRPAAEKESGGGGDDGVGGAEEDEDVEEIGDGENEDMSLLPDCEREISEADKERARLAKEAAEKEQEEAEQQQQATAATASSDKDATNETDKAAPEETDEPAEEQPADEPTVDLTEENEVQAYIYYVLDTAKTCRQCGAKVCRYRFKEGDVAHYLCDQPCVDAFLGTVESNKYAIRRKKYLAEEVPAAGNDDKENVCIQCDESKACKYRVQQEDEELFICHEDCLNLLLHEQPDRIRIRRRPAPRREPPAPKRTPPTEDPEANKFIARSEEEALAAEMDRNASLVRRCAHCFNAVTITQKLLYWEAMDFCSEHCLSAYQNAAHSICHTCRGAVPIPSLGKYCVRFGFEVRQFCRAACLDEFKKGLKVCSYCQRDMGANEEGVLAPVGEKGQFKDFCTQQCMKRYEEIITPAVKRKLQSHLCAVCNVEKPSKIQVQLDGKELNFCTNPCFSAFKFVNNVACDECIMCTKYFERKTSNAYTLYERSNDPILFCSKICLNIFISLHRKIVPCHWCKVKKYNFDMIQRVYNNTMMCSLNCLSLCEVSMNAMSMKRVKCDHCKQLKQPQYHLTMSDATMRNFCTYQCVMSFQSQFNKRPLTLDASGLAIANDSPVPTGLPKRVKKSVTNTTPPPLVTVPPTAAASSTTSGSRQKSTAAATKGPVIQAVQSLSVTRGKRGRPSAAAAAALTIDSTSTNGDASTAAFRIRSPRQINAPFQPMTQLPPPPPSPTKEVRTNLIVCPARFKQIANKKTSCRPLTETKAVSCRPAQSSVELQTCKKLERKHVIPIPVPIYVPTPAAMYTIDIPIPIPIPLPIPVPIFVPTIRNSAAGILKEIKKIHEKMPSDPAEAELLMLAEMVAGDRRKDETDSDSGDDAEAFGMDANSQGFNEDLVQMAFKMASTDYDSSAVDLEASMTANTITHQAQQQQHQQHVYEDPSLMQQQQQMMLLEAQRGASMRGRKRGAGPGRPAGSGATAVGRGGGGKRAKRDMPMIEPPQPEPIREPVEKPDANMCLKYTFGVNAWKQWVLTKNADLEKTAGGRRRLFKPEILQMTADELNYSLCLFVKEVRKPNGSEYAPDTIYYLVLGIQQYLFENGRIDNIFTDPYYEKFTECLDEVARKFSVLYNDSQYIVTRVEEEHLWECKQLGAHSPHVLLSTLMFFNTKHFNLTTVEEHMELSFSHIMKHWKRGPGQTAHNKVSGSRNVLLRYYPPQASLAANSRKKKVYEQQENEENPLRCPVKLYEFYLSKCPESVKTRNDVFYLQPERSCVPDSPVWYSTMAMSKESLSKMLHRVKMVKEINIALLTS